MHACMNTFVYFLALLSERVGSRREDRPVATSTPSTQILVFHANPYKKEPKLCREMADSRIGQIGTE